MYKILVIGAGYVGLANALMLSEKCDVTIVDVDTNKVNLINKRVSPIADSKIQKYLSNSNLNIKALSNNDLDYDLFDYIFIALPTDYNETTNSFKTTLISRTLKSIYSKTSRPIAVIRSTIPVGYCKKIINKIGVDKVLYCPEFLREGFALSDLLSPSRIIIGGNISYSKILLKLFLSLLKKKTQSLITTFEEAESIKLFSNTFLAMRVAFFNELDTFCMSKNINSKNVINGVCMDKRIGNFYNNPSFGYGGYCLPKDSKQLLANYKDIPQQLMRAAILSNDTRKKYIADYLKKKNKKIIGIYRLTMKGNSDNLRNSSIIDILKLLAIDKKIEIIIYEPLLKNNSFMNFKIFSNLEHFKKKSELILANRIDKFIQDVPKKIISRDIFHNN